ncbi:MAG: hypothetical protein KC549_17450 [Myxococcales bacterium]|nr:hypothetical protein [Myxococcales bacterium]MCB9544576.1 hypothetical protein [Myxococcales bacterium]
MKTWIALAIFVLSAPALAQPYAGGAGGPAAGGLPPFLAKMQRHDLTLRVSRRAPDGTLTPAGAGLSVGVRILANGSRVKDYVARTDAAGVALLEGVPSNPEVQGAIGYEAWVVADDVRFPFDLDGAPTGEAEIQVALPEVTTGLEGVALEHSFIELFPDEEALVARHEMRLTYDGTRAVNLGALPGGGLMLPCPPGAKHPSLHDEHDPLVEVRGTTLVFKGALLPGGEPATITVVYQIPYDAETFEWSQAMPVPSRLGVVVVSKDRQPGHRVALPLGLQVRDGLGAIDRTELDGGKRFELIRGGDKVLAANEPLRFAVTGLPPAPHWKAWVLLATIAGVIGVVLLGFRRRGADGMRLSRAHLVTERDRLVRALARMRRARDKGRMSEVRFEREREAITARLVSLYRALDRLEPR